MKILDSVKHPDGVWVQGVCDTASDLSGFDDYVQSVQGETPVEGTIVYATNEGTFYVKNSAGIYKASDEG